MSIIYKVTNIINGKCYIGKTTQLLKKRKYKHMYYTSKELDDAYFHNAIRKYGIENFKWEVIYECNDPLILGIMETMKIMVNHSHWTESGYNLTWGNDDNPMNNPEIRKKVSISKKGKNHYLYGKHLNTDHKRKISESNKGKKRTDETKRKMSLAQSGMNNPMYGKKLSNDTKIRISQSQKGKSKHKNRKYSTDVFEQSVVKHKEGVEFKEISKELNVPISTMQYWFKKCGLMRR